MHTISDYRLVITIISNKLESSTKKKRRIKEQRQRQEDENKHTKICSMSRNKNLNIEKKYTIKLSSQSDKTEKLRLIVIKETANGEAVLIKLKD